MNSQFRTGALVALTLTAGLSFAGTGQLNSHAESGITGFGGTFQDNQANFSGAGAYTSGVASATVSDPNNFSVTTTQVVNSTILTETSGSFEYLDSWYITNGSETGYADVYSKNGAPQESAYTFTTATGGELDVNYVANAGGTANGFGMWNLYIIVDGTTYYDPNGNTPPNPSGGWTVQLASGGSHTLQVGDFSNIEFGSGGWVDSMDETVNFNFNPVPEPSAALLLCPGIVGLAVFRRGRKA